MYAYKTAMLEFTLEQAMKAQCWSRGIALLFLSPRRQKSSMVNVTRYWRNKLGIYCTGGWVASRVWTGMENPASTRIRSPYCPAHALSLY